MSVDSIFLIIITFFLSRILPVACESTKGMANLSRSSLGTAVNMFLEHFLFSFLKINEVLSRLE